MVMEQAMRVCPPPARRGGIARAPAACASSHVLLLPDYLAAAKAAFGDELGAGAGAGAGAGGDRHCHGSGPCLGCGTVHDASVQKMLSKL